MRTFAIGDVHGCFDAMLSVIQLAGITNEDQVVWLGDYVDRGPDSARVVEYLSGLSTDTNIFLRGNHELMMLAAKTDLHASRSWAACGGDATWDSYLSEYGGENGLESVPAAHWQFLKRLRPYFETKSTIFVHASVDSELPLSDQFDDVLFWGDFDSIGPHVSGKHIVCGHDSQKDGRPKSRPHATCIDTWACGTGYLTCLEVRSRRFFQANQAGDTNVGWLDD